MRLALTRPAVLAAAVAVPVALVAGVLAFWALGGIGPGPGAPGPAPSGPLGTEPVNTAPVPMAAPALGERAAVVCRALLARLPETVLDLPRRPVTAGAEQNAAYGDPAITLACGVPAATYPPTDPVFTLDVVCWHAVQTADAAVWTTVDREVPVRLVVPRAYDPPGRWVPSLSDVVLASVPAATTRPFGCAGG